MSMSKPVPLSSQLIKIAFITSGSALALLTLYQINKSRNTTQISSLKTLKQIIGDGLISIALRKILYTNISQIIIQEESKDQLIDELIGLEKLDAIEAIDFSGSSISASVPRISNLKNLTKLNLSRTKLDKFPAKICDNLVNLVDLDLGRNFIREVPSEIGRLQKLKFLNLMGNQIVSLPDEICELKELYRLGLKSNKLESLPENFGDLQSLVELFITDNFLKTLPDSIGQLKKLIKLQASFNALESLPVSMGELKSLEMCRLAVNKLTSLPLEFNNLSHLAWCSIAGNTAAAKPPNTRTDIKQVKLEQLQLQQKLGDGASGEVFECMWQDQLVAVKIFQSDTSPDGQSIDEINLACAVDHQNLLKVLAQVLDEHGKCVGLITNVFKGSPLAAKPNFEYLLRCRWEQGCEFEQKFVVKAVKQVADALQYLHSLNIAHGDVYAHNVLADNDGNVVLCDMGAGYAYEANKLAHLWEAMEVRAFGLMLNDMLCRVSGGNAEINDQLRALVHVCTESQVPDRPNFQYVHNLLNSLEAIINQ